MCADHIVEKNDGIDKDELRKAVAFMKSENEEEHECNIENMFQDDNYMSPWKIKDGTVTTGLKRLRIQVIRMKTLQREKSQSQILKL